MGKAGCPTLPFPLGSGNCAIFGFRPTTTVVQEYLATVANNYYRVLAHNEPAHDAEEPADETKYDESFNANDLAEAENNENEKAFA